MKIIDSRDYNASGISAFFFPGGEPHARIPIDIGACVTFALYARTWDELGLGWAVLGALVNQGCYVRLFLPYFPGARQDRSDGQTPVTAWMVANMLGLGDEFFEKIDLHVFDIHSNYLNDNGVNLTNWMPAELAAPFPRGYVIAPDEGALGRAEYYRLMYGDQTWPVIECTKTRDFATGAITGFTMPPLPAVGRYVIVDDICDGGWTFNQLAEAFARDPMSEGSTLSLVVSHGIFSKGLSNISPIIKRIHTTDSWNALPEDDRLVVHSLDSIVKRIAST